MSVQALAWALEDAPNCPASLVSTLMGLANHANEDGCAAYPSVELLTEYTRKSERQVQRDLRALIDLHLIREGDQQLAAHYPPDRRPVVYDLAMTDLGAGRRRRKALRDRPDGNRAAKPRQVSGVTPTSPGLGTPSGVTPTSPGYGDGVTPVTERGDTSDGAGCHPRRSGVTPTSPEPSLEPSLQPSTTPPAADAPGAAIPAAGQLALVDGSAVTAAPSNAPRPQSAQKWATGMVREWWEGRKAAGQSLPTQGFPATRLIVQNALTARGHELGVPEEIPGAMSDVLDSRRVLSGGTLAYALERRLEAAAGQASAGERRAANVFVQPMDEQAMGAWG